MAVADTDVIAKALKIQGVECMPSVWRASRSLSWPLLVRTRSEQMASLFDQVKEGTKPDLDRLRRSHLHLE